MNGKPDFSFENATGKKLVAGVDEVGRGAWAGSVVAAAAIFFDRSTPEKWGYLNDSKKLTPAKRQEYFKKITAAPREISYGVGMATVAEIDATNIGKATYLAMERAVAALAIPPEVVLVDGVGKPNFPTPTLTIAKGDCLSLSIAAASIIAKVTRDEIMRALDKDNPEYGWVTNVGYGTARHMKALREFGVTAHHRKSFAPIKVYEREAA